MSLRPGKKTSPKGRPARRFVDAEEQDETARKLQLSRSRRRFQNIFSQTPSSARALQAGGSADPTERPQVIRDGKFYSRPTSTWRSLDPVPPWQIQPPIEEEPLETVELKSQATQVSEPVKKIRHAKIWVRPDTENKGNQTLPEEKEVDDVDAPIFDFQSSSAQTSFPESGEISKHQMKRIIRSMEPVTAFARKQAKEEIERKLLLGEIKEGQDTLGGKINSVIGLTGEVLTKDDAILMAIENCADKVEPCRGPHIDEEVLFEIPDQVGEVREIMESYIGDFQSFATTVQYQLQSMNTELKSMKDDQKTMSTAIENERKAREQAQAISKHESYDPESNFKEASKCMCDQMRKRSKKGSFIRCQNCQNTFNGEQFLKSNGLHEGILGESDVATRTGKIIQCIDVDAAGRLSFHLSELAKDIDDWDGDKKAEFITALFNLSSQRKSPKCSRVIFSSVKRLGSDATKLNVLSNFIKGAVSSGKQGRLVDILQNVDLEDRKELLNAPIDREGQATTYSIFEAVRTCNAETVEYLIKQGASLELLEEDKSILHEIILVSSKRSRVTEELDSDVKTILEVLYNNAATWWKAREGKPDQTNDKKNKKDALSFLTSLKNGKKQNALQYAAQIAPPYVVEHIVNHYPYKFKTDAISFGKLSGKTAYVVDEIEPDVGQRKGSSILDAVANRTDTGNDMVQIEPFRTMLNDKWRRYRIFYWIWFLAYLLYLFVLSACAVGRAATAASLADLYGQPGAYFKLAGELLCVAVLPVFFYGEYCDYSRYGWYWDWNNLDRVKSFRIANISYVICIVLTVILRITWSPYEDIFLAIALVTAWMMATQFLVPLSQTLGMFPVVYFKVFKDDFLKSYSWIFIIILLGSSIATFVAYQGSSEVVPEIPRDSFWDAFFSVVKLTFGMIETDYVKGARLPGLGICLFMLHIWLGHIILLNLFIAMVNDTYAAIKVEQRDAWIRVKAWFAMLMDRRLPFAARIQFNGLSHIKKHSFTFNLLTKLKMFTITDLIYTKRGILGVTNEEETQLIVILP